MEAAKNRFVMIGLAYIGVKSKILPLYLKGRFYAMDAFRHKGNIFRQYSHSVPNRKILRNKFWRIFLVFKPSVCT